MSKKLKLKLVVLAGAALLGLQGCGTASVSKNLTDDGRAGEVVFPDIQKTAWLKEGTFVNLANLRQVAPGVSKDQLYALLGQPHFKEGMVGVREWDYIFNFRTGQANEFATCQYKVIFDTAYKAQSFHWMPASCADRLNEKPMVVAEVVVEKAAPVAPTPMRLSADALFAFDKSGLNDLRMSGRRELDQLADKLRDAGKIQHVEVVGYTDRLGSDAYNQKLSEARAHAVRDYLVSKGVATQTITSKGMGQSNPVVQCHQASKQALIACLAPNRRVEIVVQALSKP